MCEQTQGCIFIYIPVLLTLLINYASVSIGELEGDDRGETFTSCVLVLGALRGFLKVERQRLPFVEIEN
jgi:hypothetical protein